MRARLAAALCGALACASPPCPSDTAAEQEALRVVAAYYAALAAGDRTAAAGLLAPDAIVVEAGEVETREQYLASHLAADIAFAKDFALARAAPRVVVEGDAAWVAGTSVSEGERGGKRLRVLGAELIVLTRRSAGWRIRAIHWSSRVDAP